MTETTQINPALTDIAEHQIQARWIGLLQTEYGVLQTNLFMSQARVEAMIAQRTLDLQLIEGLKKRAFTAEDNVRILQEQLKEALQSLEAKSKRKPKKIPVTEKG